MVSGAILVDLLGDRGNVIEYTCLNAEGISGGDLLVLSGANRAVSKASAADTTNAKHFVGIAASEKKPNDGSTTIGVITNCTADMAMNAGAGTVTAGTTMVISGANLIDAAPTGMTADDSGKIVGTLLDASTGTSEMVEVRVNK